MAEPIAQPDSAWSPAPNSTPLRIAVEATSLLDPHPTGIGRFTREVLIRLGQRRDLATSAFAVSWRGRERLPGVVPAGVRAVRRPAAARPLREAWSRSDWPPIEWWTGPVDVVHGTNFVVPPSRAAGEVVTVHDLTCLRFPELCTPSTRQYPRLIEQAVRRGAWIHTVSPFVADEVIDAFGVDPDRVVAVDNGPSPEPGGTAEEGRQLASGDRYVLSLGTIEPRKDLPTLVEAFDALAATHVDLRLVVAGPPGWGVDAFDAACRAAHHQSRIVRLGWVEERQRGSLLRGASVLAFPSRYEGFGLPVLEAMAAGTPVVATDAGALAHTAGGAALLVPPHDADALADALGRVLDDREMAHDLVQRGRANLDRFSWDRTTDELVALYGRAMSEPRRRRARAGRRQG